MSYIGTEPKDIRSFGRTKFDYTATQGQTAFTGADDDGKVLAFTVGQIEVYVNGILMDDSDFTTTGTGTVTLASAANLNDVINIVSFETNIPDSNYVPASGGTFAGNVTHTGNVGIGTSSPDTPLHIEDGDVTIGNSTATGDNKLIFKNTSATLAEIRAADTATGTGALLFTNNGSERMRIDSSGNVGIGTTSPSETLDVSGNIRALGANSRVMFGPDGFEAGIKYATDASLQIASRSGESITFTNGNDGTERMRIDSSGNLLVGTTDASPYSAPADGYIVALNDGTKYAMNLGAAATSDRTIIRFNNPNGGVGGINTNGSSTVYYTSSDYRLKENVTDVTDGITRVKQLAPKRFNFIVDAETTVDGFLAHEAATVVPEAVTGTHNEVDDDGNAVMQGIDQSKLVPLLTAALKEAITKIEDLETRVAALEAQ